MKPVPPATMIFMDVPPRAGNMAAIAAARKSKMRASSRLTSGAASAPSGSSGRRQRTESVMRVPPRSAEKACV
ncbi:MAG: hypothetical protein M0D55_00900 [Elusimicrobiota bacterium]|nr:MAG: hypothetical protein M0D55_00900 [Elusimicrobiota bacterium]